MFRAFVVGILVLATCFGGYALLEESARASEALTWAVALSPGMAAFAVASLSPRRKLLLGLATILEAAVVAAVINGIDYLRGGRTDFPGAGGAVAVAELQIIMGAIPALVGAAFGCWLTRPPRARAGDRSEES